MTSRTAWEKNYTEFEACHGMPARGTKELNWKEIQYKIGHKGLDCKMKKVIEANKGCPCGRIEKQDWLVALRPK
jgi:hypothetical protein